MKILIVNGSPKGEYSITLQTIKYLELLHPEHSFAYLNAGQKIRSLEKDFSPAKDAIEQADLLLFSYPVYTFIAPYQLHRFIELMKEANLDLRDKFATQLTTSKHFYDVTAHRYIEDNCKDLHLKYIRGLSADMDDLTLPQGRKEAEDFFHYVLWSVDNQRFEPLPKESTLKAKHLPVTIPTESNLGDRGDVVIVTDCRKDDLQLASMIERFQKILPRKTRVVNIAEANIKGGCLGCFQCAADGKCVYQDGFESLLRQVIQTGEAIVYAFTIRDHSMGSRFKMYDDRQFCNGHRTVTMGMPIGYLISGDYDHEFNLQMIVEGRAQVGHNFLAGVATDQHDPDGDIDRMAASLCYALEQGYVPPQNFYGVGGMKIFRDLIWLMQGMMKADHRFYKAHGQYDFPQKKRGRMLAMYLVGALLSSPKLKSKMGNKMNEGMLMPYQKALKEAHRRSSSL